MSEHPILFNSEMVRAILDGRKTQTRRVIKPQPRIANGWFNWDGRRPKAKSCTGAVGTCPPDPSAIIYYCPYGKVGDLLWVKETRWRNGGYVATDTPNINHEGKKSARFMKKIYARIWLEITGIRVERVQEITERDAKAEAVIPENAQVYFPGGAYQNGFCGLWDSINAKRGFGWDVNPWVWVIEFKRSSRNALRKAGE